MIKLFKKNLYKCSIIAVAVISIVGLTYLSASKETSNFNKSIIIYNSHPQEMYSYGRYTTEIAKELTQRLLKEGLDAYYLEIPRDTPRSDAFKVSENLIKTKVKDYKL